MLDVWWRLFFDILATLHMMSAMKAGHARLADLFMRRGLSFIRLIIKR